MAIIRGDRIAESRSLNARSIEAQDFYGILLQKVPDDFGRFRVSPSHVALALYPRRETTEAMRRRIQRLLDNLGSDLGGEAAPLFDTWVADGVTFAQLRNWTPHGNKYHRTPEPPGAGHVHTLSCLPTAIARARDWVSRQEADRLSLLMKEFRERKRTQGRTREADSGGVYSSPSSPSSPSSTSVERTDAPAPAVATAEVVEIAQHRPKPWTAEAIDAWTENLGKAPAERIGAALKPLVAEHGWPIVGPLWAEACLMAAADGRAEFFTPQTFARTFKARLGAPARAGPNVNRAAEQRKNAGNALIRGGLDAGRDVGQGDERTICQLPGPGPRRGGDDRPG